MLKWVFVTVLPSLVTGLFRPALLCSSCLECLPGEVHARMQARACHSPLYQHRTPVVACLGDCVGNRCWSAVIKIRFGVEKRHLLQI